MKVYHMKRFPVEFSRNQSRISDPTLRLCSACHPSVYPALPSHCPTRYIMHHVLDSCYLKTQRTKNVGSSSNASDLHSGGIMFEPLHGRQLSP
jgi:hypothetical protein